MSGSNGLVDGVAWTRFWLLTNPTADQWSGTPDIAGSAVGHAIGETLWVPAALLPADGFTWEPVDAERALPDACSDSIRFLFCITYGSQLCLDFLESFVQLFALGL